MMARVSDEFTTVVLDTNVVVAVVSPELIAELGRVLRRPQLAERVRATGRTAEELISRYREIAATVTPLTVTPVVVADADDDHVLALAVAARATLVITGDRSHLLPIGRHEGIAIVTPRAALDFLEQLRFELPE